MSEKLNKHSVQGWLEKRPGWSVKKDSLVKEFHFKSFRDTIVFVNRIASLADESGNRPAIDIRNEMVRLSLTTPDVGGLTQKDLELAQRIDDAVGKVLDKGLRTPDIMSEGCIEVGTAAMGDAVVEALKA